jgi:hypothetical protein
MGYFDKTRFDSIYDMIESVNTVVERNIQELMEPCTAKDLGLDPRAGYSLFVNEDFIAVSVGNSRSLDYYGGFEYVDSDSTFTVGDYKFYSTESDRVEECVMIYYAEKETAEDEMDEEQA